MKRRPGESLSEIAIANELKLSRTPVREAMKRLENEGLIVSENRRKYVYVLRIHEIEEIFELKCSIEGNCVARAAELHTDSEAEELGSIMEKVDEFLHHQDLSLARSDHHLIHDWLSLDQEFHETLFRMCRNRKAEQIVNQLNSQWHRLELGILAMEGRLAQNVSEHQVIGKAVLKRDEVAARDAMIKHLGNLRNTITSIMEIFHYPV